MNNAGTGTFYSFISKVADLTILGLLWLLTSLPVITIGASSTALYYAAVKSLRFGEGKPVQEYFRAFRQNLLQGCIGSAIYLLLMGALIMVYLMRQDGEYLFLLIAGSAMLLSSALYYFPILSRFTLNAYQCFQVSLFMIFRYFFKTLLMLGVLALCGFAVALLPFLLPLLAGCYVFYSSILLEGIFQEYMNTDDKSKDLWYNSTLPLN